MRRTLSLVACMLLMAGFAAAQDEPRPIRQPLHWAQTGNMATEGFPELTEEGFLPEGEPEYVFANEEEGQWRYASQDLRIVIRRTQSEENRRKQRILIAEVFVREGSPAFRMVPYNSEHMMENMDRYKEKPAQIAASNKLVFSMDGDYYIYRVRRKKDVASYPVGVVIRGGEILMDAPIGPKSSAYPPLDMMALFDDGDMQVYKANELTAQQLIGLGARDVLSFGPVLVRNGELETFPEVKGATPQPRAGIGMYAPGHYLAIIAEGRIRDSAGLSTKEFAEIFLSLGCPTAFNLDGGWTSAMVFMGKQLNQLDKSGVRNNARTQNEVMGIGYTELDMPEIKKK